MQIYLHGEVGLVGFGRPRKWMQTCTEGDREGSADPASASEDHILCIVFHLGWSGMGQNASTRVTICPPCRYISESLYFLS
jgi:hypothetical protein